MENKKEEIIKLITETNDQQMLILILNILISNK